MIRRIERQDGTRYQVYGMKAPCTTSCTHKECEQGRQRKVYVGSFQSEKQAKTEERKHHVTQDMIADGELAPEVDTKRTLAQAAEEWLASLQKRGSRSHESYTNSMKFYLLPHVGTLPLSRLTPARIMEWRDTMAVQFAPATVNGALTCLASVCTYSVKRRWIDKNPCSGVERVERPERDYTWIQTREEIGRLLVQLPGDVRDVVALMLGSGLRVDEVLNLEYSDVELDRRLIVVQRGSKGTVKSGKVRRVPILDAILPMLRQRALQRNGSRLLFPGRTQAGKPEKQRSQVGVRAVFKLAVKRAGLDTKLRLYDCRHTFASHWVMNQGDIFALSKVLGHHSVTVTEKYYAHLRPDHWERDYARVSFHVPAEAPVYQFKRDGKTGQITERVLVAL